MEVTLHKLRGFYRVSIMLPMPSEALNVPISGAILQKRNDSDASSLSDLLRHEFRNKTTIIIIVGLVLLFASVMLFWLGYQWTRRRQRDQQRRRQERVPLDVQRHRSRSRLTARLSQWRSVQFQQGQYHVLGSIEEQNIHTRPQYLYNEDVTIRLPDTPDYYDTAARRTDTRGGVISERDLSQRSPPLQAQMPPVARMVNEECDEEAAKLGVAESPYSHGISQSESEEPPVADAGSQKNLASGSTKKKRLWSRAIQNMMHTLFARTGEAKDKP